MSSSGSLSLTTARTLTPVRLLMPLDTALSSLLSAMLQEQPHFSLLPVWSFYTKPLKDALTCSSLELQHPQSASEDPQSLPPDGENYGLHLLHRYAERTMLSMSLYPANGSETH